MKIKNDKLFIQVACLICSVVLWIIVMIQTNPVLEKTFTNVPVTIKNLSALEKSNLVLMNSDKENLTVNVKIRGYGEQLNKINKSDIAASIDVLGFNEGTTNAKVEISGPGGIEMEEPYPSKIACVVESVVSRVMDVTVQYQGEQEAEYYRTGVTSNPSSVKITGPRSVVNSAQSAVATINIDKATDDVVKTVPVRIYDGTDTEIFMSVPTDNVKVSVPIYPTKYVKILPNIVGQPMAGYEVTSVSVKPESIKIAARKDILDTIKELNLEELNIDGINHNLISAKGIIDKRGLMILDTSSSPVVNLTVEKVIQKEFSYKLQDIELTNIAQNLVPNLNNQDDVVTVTVSGPTSQIEQFVKTDIKISANLSSAVAGINKIKLEARAEKDLNSISLSTETLDIELTDTSAAETKTE